jgi:hypothetical protein
MHTDRCGNTSGQKCHTKGRRIETEIQQFIYRDTTHVEHDMYDYTHGKWSHRNGNERFKETFRSHNRKTFNRFATEDSYTWNITHNTESIAVWNLIPEWWGSPLVQEEYREEMVCDKTT